MSGKSPFLAPYGERKKCETPSGEKIEKVYSYEINDLGQKELMETGSVDIYALIQEDLEETKIENILARTAIGDNSMLRPDGIYMDTTEMPNNLIEARQKMQRIEDLWKNLDPGLKKKYENLENFIQKSGTEDWLKDMGMLKEIDIEAPKKTKAEKTAEPKVENQAKE